MSIVGSVSWENQTVLVTRFDYTGGNQSFVVPAGYRTADFHVSAPSNAFNHPTSFGSVVLGLGGDVEVLGVPVAAGDTFVIVCGGAPSFSGSTGLGGFNGGGNGSGADASGGYGASDVRFGGSTLADRIIVAGGSGGFGSANFVDRYDSPNTLLTPGAGGDPNGYAGDNSGDGGAGQGATTSAGGAAGTSWNVGTDGVLGQGGDGGFATSFALGASAAGAGGGGYYGGGGGSALSTGTKSSGSGGGGSSWINPGLTVVSSSISLNSTNGDGIVIVTLNP